MRFISLFSGVGGFDLGLEKAGWHCVAQVEIDKHCQQVLARHWPQVPKWGDISTVSGADLPPADAVVFGSPCQDLSVAGKRAGLQGGRSSLFYEACRVIGELQDAANHALPRFIIWENVTGALSSNAGRDFGAVLDALAELGALDIAWRVLDSQWFGVPQRRRRVFVVVDTAGHCAGQIFPVTQSLSGHSDQSPQKGKDIAGTLGGGTAGGGPKVDTDRMTFIPVQDVVGTLSPGAHPGGVNGQDAHTGQLVPAVWVKSRRAKSDSDHETWVEGSVTPTLNAFDNGSESRATVLSFGWQEQPYAGTVFTEQAATLTTSKTQAVFSEPVGVRRLTPVECERLMGWPDDHTALTAAGKPVADSNRYRMCGNGVVAPVATWIAQQINEGLRKETNAGPPQP